MREWALLDGQKRKGALRKWSLFFVGADGGNVYATVLDIEEDTKEATLTNPKGLTLNKSLHIQFINKECLSLS